MAMASLIRSTVCKVEVVTPENIRLVFETPQVDSDLLQVHTSNDLGEVCGTFQLTLAPRLIEGRTYDQLIPLRSLVTIRMQALHEDQSDLETVVMVGLTEDHGLTEDFSRGQPQRVVTIGGRSMAGVFLDMQLRHYPGWRSHVQGTLTVGDQYFNLFIPTNFLSQELDPREALRAILTYFLGVKSHVPLQKRVEQYEAQQATQQQAAQQPGRSPQARAQAVQTQRQARAPSRVPAPPGKGVTITTGLAARAEGLAIADGMQAWEDANPNGAPAERQAELDRVVAEVMGRPPTEEAPPRPAPRARPPAPPPRPAPRAQPPAPPPRPPAPPPADVSRNVLMNLQLPERPLAELLDLNDDTWTLFDDDLRISIGHNTPYALSLWHYLNQFVDHHFQEFFTRIEGGVVKVFFRAKPFLETTELRGTRFSDTAPTCGTFAFTREEWESLYLGGHLRRQLGNVYNAFVGVAAGSEHDDQRSRGGVPALSGVPQ